MKEEKRHVGRPTNEEVKQRNNKKIIKIFVVATVLIVLSLILCIKTNLIKVKGNVDTSNKITNDSVYSNKNQKELKIYGVYEAKKGKKISFRTNAIGAKISISTNGLKSEYKSSIVTKKANEYIYAEYTTTGRKYITVTKKGYKPAKRQLMIIPSELKLICPTIVKVGKEFTCKTNIHNANIKVSKNGLAPGYNEVFKTTMHDMTKQTKYTTTGVKTISVSRLGYKTITNSIKVVK